MFRIKNIITLFLIIFWFVLILFFLYSKFFYTDKNIKTTSVQFLSNIEFSNSQELVYAIDDYIKTLADKSITFQIDNIYFETTIGELDIKPNIDHINSIIELEQRSLRLIFRSIIQPQTALEIPLKFDFDITAIKNKLPFKLEIKDSVYVNDQDELINCEKDIYNLILNQTLISSEISDLVSDRKNNIVSSFSNFFAGEGDNINMYKYCSKFEEKFIAQQNIFQNKGIDTSEFLLSDFYYSPYSEIFLIKNKDKLQDHLKKLESKVNIPKLQGSYEIINNKIALLSPYQIGKSLNIKKTFDQLQSSHLRKELNFDLIFDEDKPELLNRGLEIYDFTKLLGRGESRLHKVFDNYGSEIYFAEVGLKSTHNVIIPPNSEFSFYKDAGIYGGGNSYKTKLNEFVSGGICNATTTLFRGALHAGFVIKERYNHARNYGKYHWPYPINSVDSTFWAAHPVTDLKFINDTNYPALIKFEKREDSTYRYHYVNIYTSSKQPNRNVELSNWRRWNIQTSHKFESSFDRKVWEDGKIIREDNFYSKYYI